MNIFKYFKERKEKNKIKEDRKAKTMEMCKKAITGLLTKEEIAALVASFKDVTCFNRDTSNWDMTKAIKMPEGTFDMGIEDKPNDEDLIAAARQLKYVFDFTEIHGYQLEDGYKKNAMLIADRLESLIAENKELKLYTGQLEDGAGEEIQTRILEHEPVIERLEKENKELKKMMDTVCETLRAWDDHECYEGENEDKIIVNLHTKILLFRQ